MSSHTNSVAAGSDIPSGLFGPQVVIAEEFTRLAAERVVVPPMDGDTLVAS
jgi:hypothetical protein